jgi:transposase
MIRHFVGDPWSAAYGFYCRNQAAPHLVSGENISSIAVALKLSRTTVRKHLTTTEEPVCQRKTQPLPKLGGFQDHLNRWLDVDSRLPRKERRTAQPLFECLQAEGYRGAYDSVQRFVRLWKLERETTPASTKAFIPLVYPPRRNLPVWLE